VSALLTVQGLSVRYGGVRALEDVDLDVDAGTILGIIGANGAGKTTFIDALTGFTRATGRILLEGTDLRHLPPHRRARRGLVRTFQANELFSDLTVRENVHVAHTRPGMWAATRSILTGRPVPEDDSERVLELLGISKLADEMPDEISHGQRKLAALARALVSGPRVLCLDEPAAGLDSDETAELSDTLLAIASSGTAVLLVDHDMDLVLKVSDSVLALDFGRTVSRGTPDQVRADPVVRTAYLGTATGAEQ
jgi:branched-chain amino acid transport system ATP-binding protein